MSNRTFASTVVAVGFLLPFTVLVESALAQELRLTLSLDKKQYFQGEPIAVYVELSNVGIKPVVVDSRLDAELRTITYRITGPSGAERAFLPYSVADAAHPGVELEAGQSVRDISLIHFGARGWTFAEPGTYKVQASYRNDRYQSDAVSLVVTSPTEGPDRDFAREIIKEPEVGKFFLFEEGDHLKSARALLERLAKQADKSLFGAYASYMLGSAYSKSFAVPGGAARASDPVAAAQYVEQAKDRLPSAYFTAKAYMLLELNYSRMGKDTTASAMAKSRGSVIETRFPGRAPFQPFIAAQIARRYQPRP